MKKILLAFVSISVLSGCATPYKPIPFDRASSNVTNLQIVEDAMPNEAGIRKFATNGQNISNATSGLGVAGLAVTLVAAGVEANIAANQRAKVRKALESQNFNAEQIFDEALEAALKAQNYTITTNKTARENDNSFIVASAQPNAEIGTAVLDVNGNSYGYQLAGGKTTWRPYVIIQLKMTDAKNPTKVLLDNKIEYNPVSPSAVTVSIPANDEYSFTEIEDIEANPQRAAEGLKKALIEAANSTAQLLR